MAALPDVLLTPSLLPVGEELEWSPVRAPGRTSLRGSHVLVRPLEADVDVEPLYACSHPPLGDPHIWTYLSQGPYESPEELRQALVVAQSSEDPLFFALVPLRDGYARGVAAYLRIAPEFGVLEIGHVWFGTSLHRTTAGSEAIYLLARHVFEELGYRRLEWKCDALNAGSRRAAARFGFKFEGIFEKHQVVKGRNRDTAWYSITADRWQPVQAGFRAWLAATNFTSDGRQLSSLEDQIAAAHERSKSTPSRETALGTS